MRTTALHLRASLVILASAALLGACNELTGVNDLVVDGEDGGAGQGGNGAGGDQGGSPNGGSPNGGSPNGGSPNGGSPNGGNGGAGGSTDTTTTTTNPLADASGVNITQIALLQGVKTTLMNGGNPGNDGIPIVAGRDALMRLYLATDGNYNGQQVKARLSIQGVNDPIEVDAAVSGSPKDNNLNSTLNFKIPGASIQPGFSYRVDLLQPSADSKGPNPGAHYPSDGFAKTNAASNGPGIKIKLVPIQYGADGSNRVPDTSPQMVQGYKNLFMAMYPTASVDISVRQPAPYDGAVDANGNGWEELLTHLGDVRAGDNAPNDVYYYGAFAPASSFGAFCGGGCVAGLGNIGSASAAYLRAAIGLGFSDDGGTVAWETAVHEIGHTHGRYHSPCGGAAGPDPAYPHAGAIIGVWGYNPITSQLFDPNKTTDVMGYCQPIWISDYTWKGIFTRIKQVNGANFVAPPELMNLTYDRVHIDMNGNAHWLSPIKLEFPPQEDAIPLTVQTSAGPVAVTGHHYGYDHLPGGVVLWAQPGGSAAKTVAFDWKGKQLSLSR
jgi:hypothetical protein